MTRICAAHWSRTGLPPSAAAIPALIAPSSLPPFSPRSAQARRWSCPHEDRVLRLEPPVVLLERSGHLLPRHARGPCAPRLPDHVLRTRRVRPPAAPGYRAAGLGGGEGLSGNDRGGAGGDRGGRESGRGR